MAHFSAFQIAISLDLQELLYFASLAKFRNVAIVVILFIMITANFEKNMSIKFVVFRIDLYHDVSEFSRNLMNCNELYRIVSNCIELYLIMVKHIESCRIVSSRNDFDEC